jgi:hypothetical protein
VQLQQERETQHPLRCPRRASPEKHDAYAPIHLLTSSLPRSLAGPPIPAGRRAGPARYLQPCFLNPCVIMHRTRQRRRAEEEEAIAVCGSAHCTCAPCMHHTSCPWQSPYDDATTSICSAPAVHPPHYSRSIASCTCACKLADMRPCLRATRTYRSNS